jgi:hypothetical protein
MSMATTCHEFRPLALRAAGESSFQKGELDAYHLGAPPNDFANPMLPAIGKSQVEMIRDN